MTKRIPLVLVAALAFAGCGKDDRGPSGGAKEAGHDAEHDAGHDHAHEKGPHGGAVVVLGEEAAHLEVLHDDAVGRVTVHVLGGDMKPMSIPDAPVLNFTREGKPLQLKAAPESGAAPASAWVFADEALKGEPEGARFRVVIGGKTYSPEMAHAH